MKGTIVSVNMSARRGVQKTPVDRAELREEHGLVGDSHAGPGNRQVSMLALEDRKWFEESENLEICLLDGDFGENLTTEGIPWHETVIGDRFTVGDRVVLEVSKKGKECHEHCAIKETVGTCIMPTRGVFARVVVGGTVRPGDPMIKR